MTVMPRAFNLESPMQYVPARCLRVGGVMEGPGIPFD
jgi:hypothetical protein